MTDVTQTPETPAVDPVLSPRPDLAQSGDASDRAPLTQRIERSMRSGGQWTQARSDKAREMIRAHPLRMGLSAVGAGLVLGLLIRR